MGVNLGTNHCLLLYCSSAGRSKARHVTWLVRVPFGVEFHFTRLFCGISAVEHCAPACPGDHTRPAEALCAVILLVHVLHRKPCVRRKLAGALQRKLVTTVSATIVLARWYRSGLIVQVRGRGQAHSQESVESKRD